MAGSETDLANAALAMIREDPIVNIDDLNDNRAKEAKRLWTTVVRGSVLRAHDWNCVRTEQVLVSVTNVTSAEWAGAWALPNNPFCLAARRIASLNIAPYADRFEPVPIPFEVRGRILLCDETAPILIYTYLETNAGVYDDLLFDAMATRLAAELAYSRAGSFKLGDEKMQIYAAMKTPEAAGINEVEGVGARTLYTPGGILAARRV